MKLIKWDLKWRPKRELLSPRSTQQPKYWSSQTLDQKQDFSRVKRILTSLIPTICCHWMEYSKLKITYLQSQFWIWGLKQWFYQKKLEVKKIYPGSQSPMTSVRAGSVSFSTLNHRPEQSLSARKLEERREFLRKELNIDKIKREKHLKEQIVNTFFRHWDAVSINIEDFEKSELLQLHISLVPGATPICAKCSFLNPVGIERPRKTT